MKLPQLSLQELFLLVALVAMGCGWWVDRQKIAAREAAVKHDQETFKSSWLALAKEREMIKFEREAFWDTVEAQRK
jgi:hypothetical protein